MEKIHLSKQQISLLRSGNKIETPEGETYYNYPYWVKLIFLTEKEKEDGEPNAEAFFRFEVPGERSYKKGGLQESKYVIQKTDGEPVDPNAWYFVLRIDKDIHAQQAALAYALSVRKDNPTLSEQLIRKVLEFNKELIK